MKDINKIKEFFSKPLNEMEFGDPLEQIFMNYAGKTIEMEFDDPNSDWSNLIGDLEEYFPGDKLPEFMESKELEDYLDDYNIRLIDPIMDREVDLDVVKKGKAKMDIDAMRKAGGLPPLDDPASLNEHNLGMDDTLTPDMWDKEKIKAGIKGKKINDPFWFTKPHTIIDFNSRLGMISFDHPAKPKRSLTWVNSFLKDTHKVDMSAEPVGSLSTKYAKSPSAKLKMNDEIKEVNLKQSKLSSSEYQKAKKLKDFKASDWKWNADEGLYIKLTEAKSFTDYSNNELAAYVRELSKQRADAASKGQNDLLGGINKEIEAATREIKKRSQKLKNLSRTDVNEQEDHVDPMVAKAYRDYIKAKKDSAADVDFAEDPEKAYRYYSKKLNNTYSTIADRDAIEAILKKKYGSALEESINEELYDNSVDLAFDKVRAVVRKESRKLSDDGSYALGLKLRDWFEKNIIKESINEGTIEDIQGKLDALGVKYEMSKTDKVRPFKAIYKPVNKSDEFYDKFEDIVDLYNLKGVVKTSMNEALMLDKHEVDFFHTKANVYANIEIPSENPTFEDDIQIKGTGKTEEEAFEDLKQNYENYKKTGIYEAKSEEATKKEYDALLDKEHELTIAYSKDRTDANWKKLSDIREKGKKLEKELEDKGLLEATKEEETEFHAKLDKLVHDTFGKRKGEMEENMLSLDDQAKAYYLEKLKKGEIDTLPDNPKAAFLAQMTKDQIEHDEETFRRERGLEEIKQRILNKLKK